MKFIIRWDDISPYQDEAKLSALIDLFRSFQIPAVLGVIPDNRDEEIKFGEIGETKYFDTLKELEREGWEIALHGLRHIRHTADGGILGLNDSSEFAGRSFEDQFADLKAGKAHLRQYGFEPVTFIPPWHSFDNETLRAMGQAGFEVLSDGLHLYPRMFDKILQLPVIFWSPPGRMRWLRLIDGVYTICLHPQLITEDDLRRLKRFFAREKPEVVTASSLIADKERISRSGLKRSMFEAAFSRMFRKARG
jgi:predicted deacetylase